MAIPDDEHFRRGPYAVDESVSLPENPSGMNQWLMVVALVLIVAVVVAIGYAVREQQSAQRLISANSHLASELTKTQTQLAKLTAKFNALATIPAQPARPADETWQRKPVESAAASHVRHARTRPVISMWQKKMQRQLATQQRRIAAAEQAIAKGQSDFASNVANTQNSLNGLSGSIAKNHTELVALEKLGERNYYEFDLYKSKHFARKGPLGLELRHTSTKHDNYDMIMLVDDSKLGRKHVNLYEPIILETAESPQPVELVVNRIDKNHVHGYLSVPKSYGERTSTASAGAAAGSAATMSDTATSSQTETPVDVASSQR